MAAASHPKPSSPGKTADKGTTRITRHQHTEPRLPHERDESSDNHPGAEDERVKQAARDLENGLKDTGRGPVVTKIQRDHFPSKNDS